MRIRHKLILPDGDFMPLMLLLAGLLMPLCAVYVTLTGVKQTENLENLVATGIEREATIVSRRIDKARGRNRSDRYYLTLQLDWGMKKEFRVSSNEYLDHLFEPTTPVIQSSFDQDFWVPVIELEDKRRHSWLLTWLPAPIALFGFVLVLRALWLQYWRKRPGIGTHGVPYGSSTRWNSSLRYASTQRKP